MSYRVEHGALFRSLWGCLISTGPTLGHGRTLPLSRGVRSRKRKTFQDSSTTNLPLGCKKICEEEVAVKLCIKNISICSPWKLKAKTTLPPLMNCLDLISSKSVKKFLPLAGPAKMVSLFSSTNGVPTSRGLPQRKAPVDRKFLEHWR